MEGIKKAGLVLAGAAAALLASGFVAAAGTDKHEHHVKCSGVNACKGKSDCKGKDNACKSKNDCKGKGWVFKATAEECTKAGGTVVEEEKKS